MQTGADVAAKRNTPLYLSVCAQESKKSAAFAPAGMGIGSRPVSRVLSWTVIHLGRGSPRASSDLPGNACGPHVAAEAARSPIWSCSGWGLPCRRVLPPTRCALTTPFHPYRPLARGWRFVFCGTFRRLSPPQALPGTLPDGARTFLRPTPALNRLRQAATVRPTPVLSLAPCGQPDHGPG